MQKQPKLDKSIGVFGGVSILTGIMVASGIFFVGSFVLRATNYSLPLALLAWLVGGVLTLTYGLMYAELGTRMPKSGGYYVYLKEGYGRPVAFSAGFFNFVLASSGSIAVLALAFSEVLFNIVGELTEWSVMLSQGTQIGIAFGMIVLLTGLNLLGVRLNTKILKTLLIIKAIPIGLMIILGIFLGEQSFDWSINLNGGNLFGALTALGFAVIFSFWAYEGWTNLNSVAEEMENPSKDLPKSLIITIVAVTTIYVLYQFSVFRVLSVPALQAIIDGDAILPGGFTFIGIPAAVTILNRAGQFLVMSTIALGIFGALNATILAFPRVYYAMSQQEPALAKLARVSEKTKTPVVAVVVSSVMASILVFFAISDLISLVAFGGLVFNTLIFISLFKFRKESTTEEGVYHVPFYPYLPLLSIGVTLFLLLAIFIQNPVPSLIGTGVVIISFPIFYILNKILKSDA